MSRRSRILLFTLVPKVGYGAPLFKAGITVHRGSDAVDPTIRYIARASFTPCSTVRYASFGV